jgi:hypothetical protein
MPNAEKAQQQPGTSDAKSASEVSKPHSLTMKMVEVMASVDRIAKNGNNTAQGYQYAMASDVYDAVRSELARRFVLMVPRVESVDFSEVPTKSGGMLKLCMWKGAFDFTDAETGEVLSVKAFGQGSDSGDKAIYKAITGATKSVLVQLFLIPTGDDPENEKADRAAKAPPPAGADALKQRMRAAAASAPPADPAARPPVHDRNFVMPFANKEATPLHALSEKNIRWFESALKTSCADPAKANYLASNTQLLATVQAEISWRGLK